VWSKFTHKDAPCRLIRAHCACTHTQHTRHRLIASQQIMGVVKIHSQRRTMPSYSRSLRLCAHSAHAASSHCITANNGCGQNSLTKTHHAVLPALTAPVRTFSTKGDVLLYGRERSRVTPQKHDRKPACLQARGEHRVGGVGLCRISRIGSGFWMGVEQQALRT